jgi:hypothetical protein
MRGPLKSVFHRCFLFSFGSFGRTVSEKNLNNQPIRSKNRQWRSCLLTDWDGMINIYSHIIMVKICSMFKTKVLMPQA